MAEVNNIALILGGTSSGKSARGMELLLAAPGPRLMVATGRPTDQDFRQRILDHKRSRPADLALCEVGADLLPTLRQATLRHGSILVDSLDFWLFSSLEAGLAREGTAELCTALEQWSGPELILVSSETGLGPIAADQETRRFIKALGELNQKVAALARTVELVSAGLALRLK